MLQAHKPKIIYAGTLFRMFPALYLVHVRLNANLTYISETAMVCIDNHTFVAQ